MNPDKLTRKQMQNFFDSMAPVLEGTQAELEIVGLDIGDQIAHGWAGLEAVTYDRNDDVLSIAIDGIEHLIQHPEFVLLQWRGDSIVSLTVVDPEEHKHILKLRRPLALPPSAKEWRAM